jgi:[acyl-carrier-protein] S-malonyltransferase
MGTGFVTRALVFPGQGSQAVGMGAELAAAFPVARAVLEEADDALGMRLSRLMAEGPADTLTLTENAQPALVASSIAVVRVLEQELGLSVSRDVAFVAGHSLGEYSALTAAGALSLPDAVRLVRRRGEAMQSACPPGTGAMAALLGADLPAAIKIAAEAAEQTGKICAAANDNGGGQIVISGDLEAIETALRLAAEAGLKRAVKLNVSAPFHSPLMAPAAAAMETALSSIAVAVPVVPVVANVSAHAIRDPDLIRRALVEQVTGLVRWEETVLFFKSEGVDQIVELGTGKVLAGLTKRIDRELAAISVSSPADIEAFARLL